MIWASTTPGASAVQIDTRPLPAQPAQRLVHRDAGKPGTEARIAAKAVEVRKRPDIGFLDDVLSLGIVAQNAQASLNYSGSREPLTDAELVRRAGARDEAAIRSIMQANNRRLYRIARGILRNDSEAEDVVQETYVRAFTHLDELSWRFQPRNLAGAHRHERGAGPVAPAAARASTGPRWLRASLDAQIIQFPLSAASDDPEKTMAQREIQHVVEHAIDELPEAFRIVFITRVIEGMNVEETAEILDLKPETVKTRLHRARTMLRDNVEKKIGPVVMEAFPFAGKRCERLTDAVLRRLGLTDKFSGTFAPRAIQSLCNQSCRRLRSRHHRSIRPCSFD